MVNIKEYINQKRENILEEESLKDMLNKDLSKCDVDNLQNNLCNKSIIDTSHFEELYSYAYHQLDEDSTGKGISFNMFRLLCTYHNTYIHYQSNIFNIKLDNGDIIYLKESNNQLFLTHNHMVIATGTLNKTSITWSDTLSFGDEIYPYPRSCYVKLPVPNQLPDDKDIIHPIVSILILNNFKKEQIS